MSRFYGRTFQIAYVVPDIDVAIEYWTKKVGVGPFFEFPLPLPLESLSVDGEAVALDHPLFSGVAVSYSGDTMIELIQPGSAPSTYSEFLESGRRGVHHLGTWVDDYDAAIAQAQHADVPIVLEGSLPLSRFAYLDTRMDGDGPLIELIAPLPPMIEMFDMIRTAAATWDGQAPRRAL